MMVKVMIIRFADYYGGNDKFDHDGHNVDNYDRSDDIYNLKYDYEGDNDYYDYRGDHGLNNNDA
jgi:hypothetical protein